MAEQFDFTEGFDPTSAAYISAAELLMMFREMRPNADRGLIVFSSSTPDVVSPNDKYERYIWIDTTTAPYTPKIYNPDTPAWEPITLGAGAVGTAQLAEDCISLSKINITEGSALQVLRINSLANAAEWASISDLITTGSIAVVKLAPGSNDTFLQTNTSGTIEWASVNSAYIISKLNSGSIVLAKISTAGGSDGYIPKISGGTLVYVDPTTLFGAVTQLSPSTTPLQQIRTNAAADAVEWFTAEKRPKPVYASVAITEAAAANLSFTLPTGYTQWQEIEMYVEGEVSDPGSDSVTMEIDFTYESGTPGTPSTGDGSDAGDGASNTGTVFSQGNAGNDHPAWFHRGYVETARLAESPLQIRATPTAVGGTFAGKFYARVTAI